MICTSSCNISSAVVIAVDAAEKARWVIIMFVNSRAISTVDCSSARGTIVPTPPTPAWFKKKSPDSSVARKALPDSSRSPLGLLKSASGRRYTGKKVPFLKLAITNPSSSIVTPAKAPNAMPSWLVEFKTKSLPLTVSPVAVPAVPIFSDTVVFGANVSRFDQSNSTVIPHFPYEI